MRRIAPVITALVLLGGCASVPDRTTVTVAPGQYEHAFEVARRVVREAEFELARIDARAGVIDSLPRASSGFATPWIRHGSSFDDDVEGLAHYQRRSARVTFEPENQIETGTRHDDDLRDHTGPLRARVDVFVERVYKPGRRLDATSARLTSFATDPALVQRGLQPLFTAELRADPALAARLADKISTALAEVEPVGTADSSGSTPTQESPIGKTP